MPTLYVIEPGARVEKEHGRLAVVKDDEVLTAVPLAHVDEVVLVGSVGVTTPAMLALLDAGCSFSLISAQGKLRGRLQAAESRHVPLRQLQYRRLDEASFCLELSRAIVAGKLRNCRALARRTVRGEALETNGEMNQGANEDEMQTAFPRLTAAIGQTPAATTLAELRGLEGQGTKAYFAVLRAALRAGLDFGPRTRRPPKDPVNALLSLAYSLLTNAVYTAVEVAGLDVYAGFFHAERAARPALALDLMEEFRPIVADSVVLTMVNKRMLDAEDFEAGPEGGVYLSRRALKKFLAQFSRRLQTEVFHPAAERTLTYQKVLEVQARALRKCIERGEPTYVPFAAR